MWRMIHLHQCVPGTRFGRYVDLGRHAFGPKLGPWIVLPQQLIVQVGSGIVYLVTGGQCLKNFMEIACTHCPQLKQSYWILIFGAFHSFLSQLPNFNSLAAVSLAAAAAAMSLRYYICSGSGSSKLKASLVQRYSTIAWAACLGRGQIQNVSYPYKTSNSTELMFRVLNVVGVLPFAFAGHAASLEIQATIPSTTRKPSKVAMWKGVIAAYSIMPSAIFQLPL